MPRLAVHGFYIRPQRNMFLDYGVEFAAAVALENGWDSENTKDIDQVLGQWPPLWQVSLAGREAGKIFER